MFNALKGPEKLDESSPNPPPMLRPRPGFSLLELVIVMVLAGIISGLSFGKITNLIAQQRVAKAAAAITNDLQQAFAIAGRNRRPVRIVIDTAKMQINITDRAQTTNFRRTSLGSTYNLRAANVSFYPSTPVEVYPNGLASDTLSITLSANGSTRRLRVTRAGMVQIKTS